jgi:hypothetical protein
MGKIVDFVKYREKAVPNQRDGLYVEAQPPFVIIGSWENGAFRKEYRLMSENMLRDLLDEME